VQFKYGSCIPTTLSFFLKRVGFLTVVLVVNFLDECCGLVWEGATRLTLADLAELLVVGLEMG